MKHEHIAVKISTGKQELVNLWIKRDNQKPESAAYSKYEELASKKVDELTDLMLSIGEYKDGWYRDLYQQRIGQSLTR